MVTENVDNQMSLKTTLFLGLTPLIIAMILYTSLTMCIEISRCYNNWRLKRQLAIVRSSDQCLIVSNPSIDDSDPQTYPQVV